MVIKLVKKLQEINKEKAAKKEQVQFIKSRLNIQNDSTEKLH